MYLVFALSGKESEHFGSISSTGALMIYCQQTSHTLKVILARYPVELESKDMTDNSTSASYPYLLL